MKLSFWYYQLENCPVLRNAHNLRLGIFLGKASGSNVIETVKSWSRIKQGSCKVSDLPFYIPTIPHQHPLIYCHLHVYHQQLEKGDFLEDKMREKIQSAGWVFTLETYFYTVEPQFNEPLYNKVLSRQSMSPQTVLLRTTLTLMITIYVCMT